MQQNVVVLCALLTKLHTVCNQRHRSFFYEMRPLVKTGQLGRVKALKTAQSLATLFQCKTKRQCPSADGIL